MDRIAQCELAPLVANLYQRGHKPLRILVVNVFFWPRSFGGATIVAEQLASSLHAQQDTEVFVFTSQGRPGDPPDPRSLGDRL
jgi:O-antigen biosynthesis protein